LKSLFASVTATLRHICAGNDRADSWANEGQKLIAFYKRGNGLLRLEVPTDAYVDAAQEHTTQKVEEAQAHIEENIAASRAAYRQRKNKAENTTQKRAQSAPPRGGRP